MDHPMRRKDRQRSQEEAYDLLEKAEYGILSTTCADGRAYGIPISFVLMEGHIYFHCAKTGQKVENIARDARVCFTAADRVEAVYDNDFSTWFRSAVAFGEAFSVEDPEEKTKALVALCVKYLPEHADKAAESIAKQGAVTAVYRIEIQQITCKAKLPVGGR